MKPKMLKSKKGVMEDAMFWIFRILLIMFVVFALIFFVNSIMLKSIETGRLEQELLAARVINSPYCLAKTEVLGDVQRVYPGIVDKTKYDRRHLEENCIIDTSAEKKVGVKVTLAGQEPIYINQEYYEDIEPLAFSENYIKVKKSLPVLVSDADGRYDSTSLEVIVVGRKR